MSFVDAFHDRRHNKIKVVERVDGKRIYKDFPVYHTFYYEDPHGRYKTLWGEPCSKFSSTNENKFKTELASKKRETKIHESDLNHVFRCLSENYLDTPIPKLQYGFFDIETDFDKDRGFAPTDDPFSRITAITVYSTHIDKNITVVLKPDLPEDDKDYLSWEDAQAICNDIGDTILCSTEEELLESFLELIEDIDVLVTWNGVGYDIPYTVNRIERVLGEGQSARMCLFGQMPKARKYVRFKKEHTTYDLIGRIHLDYLELYQKFSYNILHSYKLDTVGEAEVGERKVPYEGTLDTLYKADFRKFIEYNRQDVMLMVKIDQKRRFLEMVNVKAHDTGVTIPTMTGSVAWIDQSFVNRAHAKGMVVPDKRHDHDDTSRAAGAYVAEPKIGLKEMVASIDINSLYPSTIRALRMSIETLVGQIVSDRTEKLIEDRIEGGMKVTEAWHGEFSTIEYALVKARSDEKITVDLGGIKQKMSAKELHDIVFAEDSSLILSANGTIFRNDCYALIPDVLTEWYAGRKIKQKIAKTYRALIGGISFDGDLDCEGDGTNDIGELFSAITENNTSKIRAIIDEHGLYYEDGKIFIDKDKGQAEFEFYDLRQLLDKISLNSAYGGLLNQGSRFYDGRIGQSVTLSGRTITHHMQSKVNELLTGKYDHLGDSIIYGDTDSCYFSVVEAHKNNPNEITTEFSPLFSDRSQMVEFYDIISSNVNDSFPEFVHRVFNTGLDNGSIIKAGREIVGSMGIFIKKKRYAIMAYDDEGTRVDVDGKPGKLKITGLEIKRTDTPKMVQDFLRDILEDVLCGATEDDVVNKIRNFKNNEYSRLEPWERGVPRKVNGVTDYTQRLEENERFTGQKRTKKLTVPGHVRASINWNVLRKIYDDRYSNEIQDGASIIVCDLKPNQYGFTSIAYPVDERLPQWFKDLPFDTTKMRKNIIDKKVENIIGELGWNLQASNNHENASQLFVFS